MAEGFFLQIGLDEKSVKDLYSKIKDIITDLSQFIITIRADVVVVGLDEAKLAIQELSVSAKETAPAIATIGDAATTAADGVKKIGEEAGPMGAEVSDAVDMVDTSMEDFIAAGERTKTTLKDTGTEGAESIGKIQESVKGLIAAFAGLKLLDVFKGFVQKASDSEDAIVKMEASLKASGVYTEEASKELQDFASSTSKATGVSTGSVLEIIAKLKNLGVAAKDLKLVTTASINLAAAIGVDATSAATMLAKELAGGSGMLGRYGIKLDDARIKAEGVSYVLQALAKYEGLAALQANTFSGRLNQLSNAFGSVKKSFGSLITENELFQDLIKYITEIIQGINIWVKDNKTLTTGIMLTTVAVGGLVSGLLALKGAMAFGSVLKAGTIALTGYQASLSGTAVAAGVAKAAILGLSLPVVALGAAIAAVAAAFAYIWVETRRAEAETAKYVAKLEQDDEKFRNNNEAMMKTRADKLGEILAREGKINKEGVLYQRALQNAIASRQTEDQLMALILAKQRSITTAVAETKAATIAANRGAFDERLGQIAAIEAAIQRAGIRAREQAGMEFGVSFDQSALQKFYSDLYNISETMKKEGEAAVTQFQFDKAVDNANAKISELLQTLPQIGGDLKFQKELVESVLGTFNGMQRSNDEILQGLEDENKEYAKLLVQAEKSGLISTEKAAAEIVIQTQIQDQLDMAAKETNQEKKRIYLLNAEELLNKNKLAIQGQINTAKETEEKIQGEVEQRENNRLEALKEIPGLQDQILILQSKGIKAQDLEISAIKKKWDAEIAGAKARKESAEYIQKLELQFAVERITAEQKIVEERRKAAQELATQIAQNSKDINDYVKNVEDNLARIRGEGPVVDVTKAAEEARALAPKVETAGAGADLRSAAEKQLNTAIAPLEEEMNKIREEFAAKKSERDALNQAYAEERAAIEANPEKLTRKQLAEKLKALDESYAKQLEEKNKELTDIIAEGDANKALQEKVRAKIAEQLAALDADIASRLAEVAERDAKAKAEAAATAAAEAATPSTATTQPQEPAGVGGATASPSPSPTEAAPATIADDKAKAILDKVSGTESLLSQVSDSLTGVLDAQDKLNTAMDTFASAATARLQEHEAGITELEKKFAGYTESLRVMDKEGLAQ